MTTCQLGKPYPLGANWEGAGVNFAVYSENADKVEVCLFDDSSSGKESERYQLREVTGHVWHGYIPGIGPGQLYGYRVDGPYEPENGLRFNPSKLLIDPYALAISGKVDWDAPLFSYDPDGPEKDLVRDERDDAWGMPKCVIVNHSFSG